MAILAGIQAFGGTEHLFANSGPRRLQEKYETLNPAA
jgi:hypothetical protein